ncbi:MAG: HAD family hydrolase [Lachnospiraceae bacterium]|nr:HAD family hydrolase [Lachnospiraceae bacterium]
MSEVKPIDRVYEKVIAKDAPIDYLMGQELTLLLKLSNRIKKYKAKNDIHGTFRLAVLGSYSIQHFVSMLDAFLMGLGIDTEIYEGEYDGIRMDVLDDDSAFYAFKPDMVLLMMDHRDIKVYPQVLQDEKSVDELVSQVMSGFDTIWSRIKKCAPGCQILQTNIVLPPLRPLGNLEAGVPYSDTEFLRRINSKLATAHPDGVTIVDMEYLASYFGKKGWFDYSSYFLTKAGYSPDALPLVCSAFARLIASARGKVYKCLVMDLDNTLWGGVVGDDGYDGIELDPHNAVGEAYRHFQQYIKALKDRGVILAVCSKNNEDTAKEPFEKNPDMILKLSDISCFVANWEDKAQNIKNIATMLNIGVDSLVFVDDNPAEREIVKNYLPQVCVVDLPEDPAYYAMALEESNAFSWIEITEEDIKRSGTYAANEQRKELMESFVDYDEYLKALDMSASVGAPEGAQMKRFAQLINKSNQFNLRTIRYSEEQLLAMKDDGIHRLIYVDLNDKFSSYGIISCIILEKRGDDCFIDTWLMSCRVLKRGVENLALDTVVNAAKKMGCSRLVGEYIPTPKNKMVENFYPSLGFGSLGDGKYELKLSDYEVKDFHIELIT